MKIGPRFRVYYLQQVTACGAVSLFRHGVDGGRRAQRKDDTIDAERDYGGQGDGRDKQG